jgi:hypothetical protein
MDNTVLATLPIMQHHKEWHSIRIPPTTFCKNENTLKLHRKITHGSTHTLGLLDNGTILYFFHMLNSQSLGHFFSRTTGKTRNLFNKKGFGINNISSASPIQIQVYGGKKVKGNF